jgi:uncharacterized protein YceK
LGRLLLIFIAVLLICGCTTTRELTQVSQATLQKEIQLGRKVKVESSSGTTSIVKIQEINEDHLISNDGQKYYYKDVKEVQIKKFTPWNVLVYPLIPVYYAVAIVVSPVILFGVIICGEPCKGMISH